MRLIKILCNSLFSFTALGIVGGILNTNVVNAKYRRYTRYTSICIIGNNYIRRNEPLKYSNKPVYNYKNRYYRSYINKHKSKYNKLIRYNKNYYYQHINQRKTKIYKKSYKRIKNFNKIKNSKLRNRNNIKRNKKHKRINTIKTKNSTGWSHQLTNRQVITQAHNQTINDINADRQVDNLSPVMDNPLMDKIAEIRAKQNLNHFTYYDKSHNNEPYELEEAKRLGIKFGKGNYKFTENLVSSALNTKVLASSSGAPAYYNHNGIDMANNANDDFTNYDTYSKPNALFNILYKPWKNVGVGVANKGHIYDITEEFATTVTQNNNNQQVTFAN